MKYKNIIVYRSYGTWQADYNDGKNRFALHRSCCKTKAQAYEEAKANIDYLNSKEAQHEV